MKVLDVDSTGKATLVRNLVAPVRVPDVRQKFTVTLPGFVHRFENGHSIRLVVAGGSTNYRGGVTPTPVSIPTGSSAQVLKLPVVP
jgi:ABC-2 type transport system ATP-binding protein